MCTSNLDDNRIIQLKDFSKKYDLNFSNLELLNQAFCHTSFVQENNLDVALSYERLEFLGDAVLKLAISEILYNNFQDFQEGVLTKIRAQVVSDRNIFEYAKKLGIEELIILGRNEKKHGGAKKESILACAFEALLGAIFLEYKENGYFKALEFLKNNFLSDILEMEQKAKYSNPKAILQEYTQGINQTRPEYNVVNETGQAHDKTFFVEVSYENKIIGSGSAKSIKEAQQQAALDAIKKLKIIEE